MIPENTTVLLDLSPNQHQTNPPKILRHLRPDIQCAALAIIRQSVHSSDTRKLLPRLHGLAALKRAIAEPDSVTWQAADELLRLTLACPNRLEQFASSLVETMVQS